MEIDDGGSSAEIIRVIGGPAIGDIRSRLVRLADASTLESQVYFLSFEFLFVFFLIVPNRLFLSYYTIVSHL